MFCLLAKFKLSKYPNATAFTSVSGNGTFSTIDWHPKMEMNDIINAICFIRLIEFIVPAY